MNFLLTLEVNPITDKYFALYLNQCFVFYIPNELFFKEDIFNYNGDQLYYF